MRKYIENFLLDNIKPYPGNPRKNDEAVDKVKNSIQQFGFNVPITLDVNNVIITGHARHKAAKSLGLKNVPVIIIDNLSSEKVKAFRIMDNKTQEYAEWDMELLNIELEDLKGFDFGMDFKDAFDIKEPEMDDALEAIPENVETIAKKGQIWQLGKHRLMCGDSTSKEDVDKLLNGNLIDSLVCDPPYGVDYSSKNEMLNAINKCRRIITPIKNDNIENYREWFASWLRLILFADYNTIFVFMSGLELHNLRLAFDDAEIKWGDYLIWVKNHLVLGRKDYNSKYELCVYGWKGKHKFYGDATRTTLLEFDKPQVSDLHPTQKPLNLIKQLIEDGSKPGMNVLDLFGGSGTTLLVCEQTSRHCFMMELDEHYCDVIIKRWEDMSKQKAQLIDKQ